MSRLHLATILTLGLAAFPSEQRAPQDSAPQDGATDSTSGPKRSSSVAAVDYALRPLRGFDIRFAPALCAGGAHADLGSRAADALERDLGDLIEQVPGDALPFLRSVPIYVGDADPVTLCACYHPSARWLSRNGFDPAKAKSVEIANARTYLAWRTSQPSMVLHELAHAWFDQLEGADRDRIQQALERTRERGVYDRVLRSAGQTDRHYALTNLDEYFAETTEALFGVNDFYPFVRAELLTVDPIGAALVAELWGAPPLASEQMTLVERASAEVRQLHTFFGDWFAGRVDKSDEGFARLEGALAADFRMVTPEGRFKGRDFVLRDVRRRHGQARDGSTSVEILDVRRLDGIRVLVTYRELQVQNGGQRVLVSTALLAQDPNAASGFVWHHLHETQLQE